MKELLGLILFVGLVIWGMLSLINAVEVEKTEECKKVYGQEWVGKYSHYNAGPDCVGPNGEGKYIQ